MSEKYPLPGFETIFIARNEINEEALKNLNEKIAGIIKNHEGEIIVHEDWGKRKLAYPIEKESRGHYVFTVYTGTGPVVAEIERNLRIHDHVLRFLTINIDKEFSAENFKKRRVEMKAMKEKADKEHALRMAERAARGGYRGRGGDRGDRGDRGGRGGDRGDRGDRGGDRPDRGHDRPRGPAAPIQAVAPKTE